MLPASTRVYYQRHHVGGLTSQMCLASWEHELAFESDVHLRDYIYYGVRDGFIIVDLDASVPTYHCPIYV